MSAQRQAEPTSLPAPQVPDKVATEGLEAQWNQRWEDQGTYRFDPKPPPPRGLLDRHSPAHGFGFTSRRPRVLVHAHRCRRAFPANAG